MLQSSPIAFARLEQKQRAEGLGIFGRHSDIRFVSGHRLRAVP